MQSIAYVYNKVVVYFDKNVARRKKSTDDPREESIIEDPKEELFAENSKRPYH